MEQYLICRTCMSPYDNAKSTPHIIPCGNGHTVCSSCIQNLLNGRGAFKCPHDQVEVKLKEKKLTEFPLNLELNTLLQGIQNSTICREHPTKLRDLVCMDCKVSICVLCERQEHKSHDTEVIDYVLEDAKRKREELEKLIWRINGSSDYFREFFDVTEIRILKAIEDKYIEFCRLLAEKKEKEVQTVQKYFTLMKSQSFHQAPNQQIEDWVYLTTLRIKEASDLERNRGSKKNIIPFGIFEQKRASTDFHLEDYLKQQQNREEELRAEMESISVNLNEKYQELLEEQLFRIKPEVNVMRKPEIPVDNQKGLCRIFVRGISTTCNKSLFQQCLKENEIEWELLEYCCSLEGSGGLSVSAYILADFENTQKLLQLDSYLLIGKDIVVEMDS